MTRERRAFSYQAYYCEENVWQLASADAFRERDCRAVFVSNAKRQVPLWCQRASPDPEQPVLWDYHVFLVARLAEWTVFDHDTTLPFGVALDAYIAATFRFDSEPYAPRFACIDAADYVRDLATDRSHMLTEDGDYRAPPPAWPAIGIGTNLEAYIESAAGGVCLADLVRAL